MSVMQLKKMFVKGVFGLKTPLAKDKRWCWWLNLNEGGGPLVLSAGWFRGSDNQGRKLFLHTYCFGKCYNY